VGWHKIICENLFFSSLKKFFLGGVQCFLGGFFFSSPSLFLETLRRKFGGKDFLSSSRRFFLGQHGGKGRFGCFSRGGGWAKAIQNMLNYEANKFNFFLQEKKNLWINVQCHFDAILHAWFFLFSFAWPLFVRSMNSKPIKLISCKTFFRTMFSWSREKFGSIKGYLMLIQESHN